MHSDFRSLYLHFPFCETKCHYCDFYSLAESRTTPSERSRFIRALEAECRLTLDAHPPTPGETIDTVFLGGGTPSLTPPEDTRQALQPLLERFPFSTNVEWTMEANPSSTSRERIEAYRAIGVNRVSLGVQSLRDDLLVRMGRVHTSAEVFQALDAIFEAGIRNVSVDLLCGIPGQSLDDLESAIDRLTAYPITHLSCYLLTLAPHHRMFPELPDEDVQMSHLLHIDRSLTDRGFSHYEISNFAKPGFEARHNLAYWKRQSYLGLGPSAHAFDRTRGQRWKNISSLHSYCESIEKGALPIEWTETLTPEQERLEEWLLALRLSEGFPKDWLKTPAQESLRDRLLHDGLMEEHPEFPIRLRLTARGFPLSDEIVKKFANE